VTIKVSNPNQEMFVAAFHNGLKAGHFNESLAQKPATSMQELSRGRNVTSRAKKVTPRKDQETREKESKLIRVTEPRSFNNRDDVNQTTEGLSPKENHITSK
jgi:hypothetical protein